MAKTEDKKSWALPIIAFAAGTVASAAVAVMLTMTGTRLPAMAAVSPVSVVIPERAAEKAPESVDRSHIATDWTAEREAPRMKTRGNVVSGESAPEPQIRSVSFRTPVPVVSKKAEAEPKPEFEKYTGDPNIRWFNARPVRPAKTIWMNVSGYSPDEQSCGDSADGVTATMHSVTTNAMKMVAADTSILPYGSMVTVPGYDDDSIVPVLDCGGAIKGAKLDLMFPTHEEAKQWGRQRILVTVWEYADGKPAEDVRKLR